MKRTYQEFTPQIQALREDGNSWRAVGNILGISAYTARVYGLGFTMKGYRESFAKLAKKDSYREYFEDLVKRQGCASPAEYRNALGRRKGYRSRTEYGHAMEKRRQKNPEYRMLGKFVKDNLRNIGKTQNWLAQCLGKRQQAISLYAQGKNMPDEETAEKIFLLLAADCKTLEEITR